MSVPQQQSTLVRVSLHLLAVLVLVSTMVLVTSSTASAQPCSPGSCTNVTIFNCSNPPMPYDVEFLLCCNGNMVISPIVNVPPTPCGSVSFFYTPPPGCTILNVWNVMPPWATYTFNFASCTLVMF